jgi:hypothetical protein
MGGGMNIARLTLLMSKGADDMVGQARQIFERMIEIPMAQI